MIIESHEAKKENDQIRIEIIRMVMQISTTKVLKRIKAFLEYADEQEQQERPMNIMDISRKLNISDIGNILAAISDANMNQIAALQIKEAFSIVLDNFTRASDSE